MRALRLLLAIVAATAGTLAASSCGNTVDNDTCPVASGAYYPEVQTNDDNNVVGQLIPQMPHTHVEAGTKVTYEHNPPTSGCHYSATKDGTRALAPIPRGAYTEHVDPEYWVHNLEHGYIVVLYDCGDTMAKGCPDDFAALRTWMGKLPPDAGMLSYRSGLSATDQATFPVYTKVLILPWSNFGHKFAAVSWDYYLPLDSADTGMLQKFYDNHVGHSPEGLGSG